MLHLYLVDDNKNKFNYVWSILIKDADHCPIQAEQCCLIANNTGKCHIKSGDIISMNNLKNKLSELGLSIEMTKELYV